MNPHVYLYDFGTETTLNLQELSESVRGQLTAPIWRVMCIQKPTRLKY